MSISLLARQRAVGGVCPLAPSHRRRLSEDHYAAIYAMVPPPRTDRAASLTDRWLPVSTRATFEMLYLALGYIEVIKSMRNWESIEIRGRPRSLYSWTGFSGWHVMNFYSLIREYTNHNFSFSFTVCSFKCIEIGFWPRKFIFRINNV